MELLEELLAYDRDHYLEAIDRKFPAISLVMEQRRPIVIYGAARLGKLYKNNLHERGIRVSAFADGNQARWGERIDGITIIPPDDIKKTYPEAAVLIASMLYESEIHAKLKDMSIGLIYPLSFLNLKCPDIFISTEYYREFDSIFDDENRKKILRTQALWEDEESRRIFINIIKFRLTLDKSFITGSKSRAMQYHEPGVIHLHDQEVFLDCGAYDGDTVRQFSEVTGGSFKRIYAFEPDDVNWTRLMKTVSLTDSLRVIPVKFGVYKTTGMVGFHAAGAVDSRIRERQAAGTIPVVSIDDFMKDKEAPTFIKMDIEGGEQDAIIGARQTIRTNSPKLAISVYHNAFDLWSLPLLIKSLNERYKLYLRHYTNEIIDTVCYAV